MGLDERVDYGTASQMITADADFALAENREAIRVDLACGKRKKPGFIGIDAAKVEGVDIVHNLDVLPWPFESNSVYEFFCSHYVEHCRDLIGFMQEVWRCLKVGGTIEIHAPYYTSIRAVQDPTHVRNICDVTFDYFNQEKVKAMGIDHYTGNMNFDLVARTFVLNAGEQKYAEVTQAYRRRHLFNVVDDIQFILRKKAVE